MKNYYNVTFQYSDSVYCSNIAHAEDEKAVKARYSKYPRVYVSPASDYDVEDAKHRGKPIIEC